MSVTRAKEFFVKLATELRRRNQGDTLDLLDEPTSGLHPSDSDRLIGHLQHLVDLGNTVIIVEHDMRVVAQADWLTFHTAALSPR